VQRQASKSSPLAGFLVSMLTIMGGFVGCFVLVVLFSRNPQVDLAILVITFGAIMLVPISALRSPRNRLEGELPGRRRRWLRQLLAGKFRGRKRSGKLPSEWRRKPGQKDHRPWGHPEWNEPARPRASTFVRDPRRPVDPGNAR